MQMRKSNRLDQNLIDNIIRVVYGDAGIFDWIYIHLKSAFDKEIKTLLMDYKNTAKAVHHLKQQDVPDYIIKNVNKRIDATSVRKSIFTVISHELISLFGKRAIPATVIGFIIAFVISFLLLREPEPIYKYSEIEIEIAEQQLKHSLAIVGKAFQTAEKNFNEEILNNQINKNFNRGFYLVNNILIGG